jgi:hypothetical protein
MFTFNKSDYIPDCMRGIVSDIDSLRIRLEYLREKYPELFMDDCGNASSFTFITDYWEFWSTDEILESLSDDIKEILKTCG